MREWGQESHSCCCFLVHSKWICQGICCEGEGPHLFNNILAQDIICQPHGGNSVYHQHMGPMWAFRCPCCFLALQSPPLSLDGEGTITHKGCCRLWDICVILFQNTASWLDGNRRLEAKLYNGKGKKAQKGEITGIICKGSLMLCFEFSFCSTDLQ